MSIIALFDKHLIPDWRQAWKYLSVQLSSFYVAFAAAWPHPCIGFSTCAVSTRGLNWWKNLWLAVS